MLDYTCQFELILGGHSNEQMNGQVNRNMPLQSVNPRDLRMSFSFNLSIIAL